MPPKKRPRWSYTETDVTNAIFDITDNGMSVRKAGQKHGVPANTLSTRMNGGGSKDEAQHPDQRLTDAQEERIVTWILRQEQLGYAPSHSQVRSAVEVLIRQSLAPRENFVPLGKNWLNRFTERHPKIKTKIGKRQEAVRFKAFTPKAVNWYFDIREDYTWIKPENTVNVDKGGIMGGYSKYITL